MDESPDLVSRPRKNNDNSLGRLAEDLYNRGVRRIKGNIIGDESYFRGEPLGDGWQWNDMQWYFGAEASALSINGNEVGVNIMPPDKTGAPPLVKVSAPDGYVLVQNNLVSVNHGERLRVGLDRELSTNNEQCGETSRLGVGVLVLAFQFITPLFGQPEHSFLFSPRAALQSRASLCNVIRVLQPAKDSIPHTQRSWPSS